MMPGQSPAGATQVIEVALTLTTLEAARPPTVTVAPAAKPVPVRVRAVPPLVGPVAGATVVSVEVEAGRRAATAANWLLVRVCSACHLLTGAMVVPGPVLLTALLVEQSVRLALAGGEVSGASGKGTGLMMAPVGWLVVPLMEWL